MSRLLRLRRPSGVFRLVLSVPPRLPLFHERLQDKDGDEHGHEEPKRRGRTSRPDDGRERRSSSVGRSGAAGGRSRFIAPGARGSRWLKLLLHAAIDIAVAAAAVPGGLRGGSRSRRRPSRSGDLADSLRGAAALRSAAAPVHLPEDRVWDRLRAADGGEAAPRLLAARRVCQPWQIRGDGVPVLLRRAAERVALDAEAEAARGVRPEGEQPVGEGLGQAAGEAVERGVKDLLPQAGHVRRPQGEGREAQEQPGERPREGVAGQVGPEQAAVPDRLGKRVEGSVEGVARDVEAREAVQRRDAPGQRARQPVAAEVQHLEVPRPPPWRDWPRQLVAREVEQGQRRACGEPRGDGARGGVAGEVEDLEPPELAVVRREGPRQGVAGEREDLHGGGHRGHPPAEAVAAQASDGERPKGPKVGHRPVHASPALAAELEDHHVGVIRQDVGEGPGQAVAGEAEDSELRDPEHALRDPALEPVPGQVEGLEASKAPTAAPVAAAQCACDVVPGHVKVLEAGHARDCLQDALKRTCDEVVL
mmetsp:Transcript_779/g.1861  ORF Transcript_779/g.1861 Transcript_779/m.1861 type:complete len:534 (-) Transcript_779:1124-2725(-)